MEEKILRIANELFCETITHDTKMGDVESWDSLGQINLFMAIESELGLNFKPEEVIEKDSIKKILDLVNNNE